MLSAHKKKDDDDFLLPLPHSPKRGHILEKGAHSPPLHN